MSPIRRTGLGALVTAAAMASVGLGTIPARDVVPWRSAPPEFEPTYVADELSRIRREANAAAAELQQLLLMDSLSALTRISEGRLIGAWLGENERVSDAHVEAVVRSQFETSGRGEPAMLIGALAGRVAEPVASFNMSEARTRILSDATIPFCLVVGPSWVGATEFGVGPTVEGRPVGILGGCFYYGKYGQPGEHIEAWLRRGAFELAWMPSGWETSAPALDGEEAAYLASNRRSAYRREACMAGRLDACASMLSFPFDDRRSPMLRSFVPNVEIYSASLYGGIWTGVGRRGYALLADIETEFGEEAMRRFWSSDKPVTDAFVDAFAVSLGEWAFAWTVRHYGEVRPGPLPTGSEAMLSTLWIGLLAVGSVSVARRRKRT